MKKKPTLPEVPNPMLVFVIHRALMDRTTGGEIPGAMRNAAVHAWYEAHVEAEDARRPASFGVSQAMAALPEGVFPMPPFPTVDAVRAIVVDAMTKFGERGAIAGVAYAAALGWKGGYDEGEKCEGCSFRGTDPEFARRVRTGGLRLELRFIEDRSAELFDEPPERSRSRRVARTKRTSRRR